MRVNPVNPPLVPMGRIIAKRVMRTHDEGRQVTLSIGTPIHVAGWAWACPYRISGLGKPILGRAFGVDALQTLQLVTLALRADLESTRRKLTWLKEDFWQFGFQKPINAFDDPKLERHLLNIIEKETTKWIKTRKAKPQRGKRP